MRRIAPAILVFMMTLLFSSCGIVSADASSEPQSPIAIETYSTQPSDTYSRSDTESYYYVTSPTSVTTLPSVTSVPASSEPATVVCDQVTQGDEYTITDYETVMYANASVNVRALPDASSDRITHLDEGEKVLITGIVSNGWYRISLDGKECFVNGRYLSDFYDEALDQEQQTATEPVVTTTEHTTTVTTTTTEITTQKITTEDEEEIVIEDEIQLPTSQNKYTAINYENQKAVWFAYLDIDNMLANATEQSFRSAVSSAFTDVFMMGCNTVYVHVRAFGDSYYYSSYYPFAASYSGTLGIAPPFDPLEIMIEEAHRLGLSFHAWINPMRTTTEKRFGEMDDSYILKQWYNSDTTNGSYLVYDSEGGYYWLSPAYTAVRQLICNGIAELVSRYDIDAIHIDDYFYPTTDPEFDESAFKASGCTDLSQWRLDTVSLLVREMYSTVKSCNSTVLFGVSPQGNIKNNLSKLYADVSKWCQEPGYLDYVVPQIYYGYSGSLPFDQAAREWSELVTNPDVQLIYGLAAYKIGTTSEWSDGDMLARQAEYAYSLGNYDGIAFYRYSSVSLRGSDASSKLEDELINVMPVMAKF